MQGSNLRLSGAFTCGLLLCAVSAVAAPITGSFLGTGNATVSFTNLNFCPNGQTPDGPNEIDACGFGTGNILLFGGEADFAGVAGNLNTVESLSSGTAPVGVTVSIPGWMEFNPAVGAPPISLTLTQVLPGSFSSAACDPFGVAAAGQTCTPVDSAFNLANQTANSSSATFQVIGNAVNGISGDTSPFVAIVTSQFTVPYQQLLLSLLANQGTGNYSSSYSMSVTVTPPNPIPEPVTLSLVGGSLIGLVMMQRRRARK